MRWSLAVSDLDADGHPDLAVGDDVRGLELFLGRGDGTFAPFEHLVAGDEGGRQDVMVLRACAP